MPLRIRSGEAKGAIEFTGDELASLLAVEPDHLASWAFAIPPERTGENGVVVYRLHDADELNLWRRRSLVLRRGMSRKQLEQLEAKGVLPAYAALALDCPLGIPLNAWRSYAIVVYMQVKHGVKLDAEELARRAKLVDVDPATGERTLGVKMAERHLNLLQHAAHVLRDVKPGMRVKITKDRSEIAREAYWEHKGIPLAWQDSLAAGN